VDVLYAAVVIRKFLILNESKWDVMFVFSKSLREKNLKSIVWRREQFRIESFRPKTRNNLLFPNHGPVPWADNFRGFRANLSNNHQIRIDVTIMWKRTNDLRPYDALFLGSIK